MAEWATVCAGEAAAFTGDTARKWYACHTGSIRDILPVSTLALYNAHKHFNQVNRPDTVIKDHKSSICFLIDMVVPADCNVFIKSYQHTWTLKRKCHTCGI